MNDTAILTGAATGERAPAPEELASPKRAFAWAGATTAVCLAALAYVLAVGNKSFSELAAFRHFGTAADRESGGRAVSEQFGTIAWQIGAIATVSSATALLALSGGVAGWRRVWRHRLKKAEDEARWRTEVCAALQAQLGDSHRTEEALAKNLAEIRAQFADLTQQKAGLQAELNSRKKVERSFSQQRQSLESSKTVLEMHVQARSEELEALQHRYELILNSAGEGICGMDREGKATFVNPVVAQVTGWPLEELIGRSEKEIFYPNGAAGPGEDAGESVFYRKDGSRFPVEFVRTIIEESGVQTGSVLMFKDITERKRAEDALAQNAAELARSNAELEQFAFVASHDLQEPLRKIQAFGDRVKTKLEPVLSTDSRDYLDRMQGAAARMRTLIDDLLTFSRVIRSSEPFVPADLGRITREVLGDLEVRIEKSAARVEIGELHTIDADPSQMRQLMLNLIGNALKFQAAGAQPVIKIDSRLITTLAGELFCELTVADNGIGFEDQYAEKIFVVFQRLHGRGEYEGTGVGLAVCRRIADRHKGTITAKGIPGHGSTFTVTLPVRQSLPKPPLYE
ncbi:MAG TPA: ATP-binding protein [Candidatus Binatia bacterium]|nr:ATP-binding protein [Candidatus Binatia bacterium]